MLVEPFLPVQACAGGPNVNYKNPPKEKIDPKTGRPQKTDEDRREENRLAEIIKWEREKDQVAEGKGLGNWLQPVMDYGGDIVDHNPITDAFGKILPGHKHGKSGEVDFGTPWDTDQEGLKINGLGMSEATKGKNPHREKDGKRIHILPDVAWREYATDPFESTKRGDDPEIQRKRETGVGFSGWSSHPTTEVAQLDTVKMHLDPSAQWDMHRLTGNAHS